MEWVAAAGAVMGMMQQGQKAEQSASMYEAQQGAKMYDAAIMRQRAETTKQLYGQKESQQRREAALFQGMQRAAIGQSGTGVGGSNADIEHQSMVFQELDALNIRYQGDLEARGLLSQASLDEYDADIAGENAESSRSGGFLGMAGALLSGAGAYMKAGGSFGFSGGGSIAPTLYAPDRSNFA